LQLFTIDENDDDLEKPFIFKRPLQGYLKYPNGNYAKYQADFEISPPSDKIVTLFRGADKKAKLNMIIDKLGRLADLYRKDTGQDAAENKIKVLIDYYTTNPDKLTEIGKYNKTRGYMLLPKTRELHSIDRTQAATFEKEMTRILKRQSQAFFDIDNENEDEVIRDA
jgi:hypothetical protein